MRYKIRFNVSARPPREREIRILRDEIRESVLARTLLAELMLQAASASRRTTAGAVPIGCSTCWPT